MESRQGLFGAARRTNGGGHGQHDANLDAGASAAWPKWPRRPAAWSRSATAVSIISRRRPRGFRLLVDRLPQDAGTHDFFSGIAIAPGSDARRQVSPAAGQGLEQLKRMAQSRRNLQAILAQAEADQPQAGHWLAEIGQLVRSLDESSGAEILFQLGERYYHQGRWDWRPKRFRWWPIAIRSIRWPARRWSGWCNTTPAAKRPGGTGKPIGSSAEQVGTVEPTARAMAGGKTEPSGSAAAARDASRAGPTDRHASGLVGPADQAIAARRSKPPRWPNGWASSMPRWLAEPRVGFPLAIAHRRQGYPRQAERFYLSLTRAASARCLVGGGRAAKSGCPRGRACRPSRSPLACATAAKPRLDGQLDDAVWRQNSPAGAAQRRAARMPPGRPWRCWPTTTSFCIWPPVAGKSKRFGRPKSKRIASTTPTSAWQDRIEFCLDLDRDWTTFYRLSIDQRGCTHDECWHDATWNPRWFVAAARQDDTWTVEAAVPLVELTRDFPTAGQAWALGVTRIAPGVGLQSWTTPAGAEPVGEGFGLLLFE